MATKRPPALKRLPNVEFLNNFRNELASPMYQARIPNVTKATLQDNYQRLSEIPELRNEVISALINRVGREEIKGLRFDNPLEPFRRQSLIYGNVFEEVQLGLLKGKAYDPTRSGSERDLFAREYAEAQSSFHTTNRRLFYKQTIDEPGLRAAFTGEEGLSNLVTTLMSQLNESDKFDEFSMMSNLLHEMYKAGGYFKVQIDDITASSAGADEAKAALKSFRTFAELLKFPSRRYNSAGMMVSAQRDELVMFMTPEANATIDVDGLAALFNVERGEVPFRVIVIPQEYWPIPGAQAVLTTYNFFVVMDTYYGTGVQPNEAGRYTNYFLHHDGIVSMSRFVPAVLFTTEPGTPIEIAPTPVVSVTGLKVIDPADGTEVTQLKRGGVYQVEATANTEPAEGLNDAVRFSLEGKNATRTRVWQNDTFVIARDETATSIEVIASATDTETPQIVARRTYSVVESVIIEFPPQVIEDEDGDGLFESDVPEAPTFAANVITIPHGVEGVQYRDGATNLAQGVEITITANKTITAVALPNYEIPSGSTVSWSFTHTP